MYACSELRWFKWVQWKSESPFHPYSSFPPSGFFFFFLKLWVRLVVLAFTLYEVWYSTIKYFCEVHIDLAYRCKDLSCVSSSVSGQKCSVFSCVEFHTDFDLTLCWEHKVWMVWQWWGVLGDWTFFSYTNLFGKNVLSTLSSNLHFILTFSKHFYKSTLWFRFEAQSSWDFHRHTPQLGNGTNITQDSWLPGFQNQFRILLQMH